MARNSTAGFFSPVSLQPASQTHSPKTGGWTPEQSRLLISKAPTLRDTLTMLNQAEEGLAQDTHGSPSPAQLFEWVRFSGRCY